MARREALIVGAQSFTDSAFRGLKSPEVDLTQLLQVLGDQTIGNFQVARLIDRPVHEVRIALDAFFANREAEDLLLIYFTGHGLRDDRGHLFYVCHDTLRDRLASTGLASTFVSDLAARSASQRQVLIIDCCFSGAFLKGMVPRAPSQLEIHKDDVAPEGTGLVILTASTAFQYAFEGDSVTGTATPSIFTQHVVEGLSSGEADLNNDGQVDHEELYQYVKGKMRASAGQTPMRWVLGATDPIAIAANPRPRATTLPCEIEELLNHHVPDVRVLGIGKMVDYACSGYAGRLLAARKRLVVLSSDDSNKVRSAANAALAVLTAQPPINPLPSATDLSSSWPSSRRSTTAPARASPSTPASEPPPRTADARVGEGIEARLESPAAIVRLIGVEQLHTYAASCSDELREAIRNRFHRLAADPATEVSLAARLALNDLFLPTTSESKEAFHEGKEADVTVKIGHVAPLTGSIAHLGADNENGARIAIDEINARGGLRVGDKTYKLELVSGDDEGDPKESALAAQKMVNAGVVAVVGHLNSGASITASKIYSDAGVTQISPSATNPKLTEQGFETTFRIIANDRHQGSALATVAADDMRAKTVAIIDDRTAYGRILAEAFEKAAEEKGMKVVAREFTNDKATDFNAILTKVRAARPDVVMYGGMDATAGPMAQQMRQLGIKAPMLAGDGACSSEFMKLAGDAASILTCSMAGEPVEKLTKGEEFTRKYKAKFNAEVQVYSPYSYDAVYLIAEAIKRAGSSDRASVKAAMHAMNYAGLTGNIAFDEKGDIKNGAVSIFRINNGRIDYVKTMR